jgi:uncharacterized repeat protein (TIGR01451 family)
MKQVAATFVGLLLVALAGTASGSTFTDTSQADFKAGTANGVDLTTSPGNVQLIYTGSGGAAVDQQNTSITINGDAFTNIAWTGQTFTAHASGALVKVDVNLFCSFCGAYGNPPPIIVSIRATSGGLPTGSDLASASLTITDISGLQAFYSATFSAPTNLTAGTQYALLIHASAAYGGSTGKQLGFSDSAANGSQGGDVYGGGSLIHSTNGGSGWSVVQYSIAPTTADGGFRTYIGGSSGYNSAGDLISSLKDSNPPTGSTPTWSTLSWTASVPANTGLKFQAAASNSSSGPFTFVGPDGTSATFFTATNASLSQFTGNRYLKYRAFLSTSSSSATPVLNDVTVNYTNVAAPVSADLSITNSDGATSEVPGTSVVYTITAANAGPSNVTSASVSDNFQAPLTSCHWTCAGTGGGTCQSSGSGSIADTSVSLPVGATAVYTATCTLPSSANGSVSNTATISPPSGVTDPATGNNSATDSEPLTPQADLSLTNSDGQTQQTAGLTATYTIEAINAGPSDAPAANVTDAFPSTLTCNWTCTGTFGGQCPGSGSGNINQAVNLPKGAHTKFTATCSIASSATGTLANPASAASGPGVTDPNSSNNTLTDSDSINIRPDVQVTMTDNQDMVQIGGLVDYVIEVSNRGPSDAVVNLTDNLPSQLSKMASWVCSGTGGATCSKGNGNTMSTNATVPVGGVATYIYSTSVVSDDAGDAFSNVAHANVTNGSDPNGTNNAFSDNDVIVVFLSGFEGASAAAMVQTASGGGSGSMTIDLGVDAGLLNNLGPAPVTVATGRSASGGKLFSLQLLRLGGDVMMRTSTTIDDTAFSDTGPWQAVDLNQHLIRLQWQSASSRGDDGYLSAGSATREVAISANNARENLTRLQVKVENNIPWLVPVEP